MDFGRFKPALKNLLKVFQSYVRLATIITFVLNNANQLLHLHVTFHF